MRPPHINAISCHTCKFWEVTRPYDYKAHQSGHGDCRRYAPTRNEDRMSVREFPGTYDHDWCGDWAKRPKPSRNKRTQSPITVARGVVR